MEQDNASSKDESCGSIVDLSRRKLTLLPLDDINQYRNTKTLLLSFNKLTKIHDALGHLSCLTTLELRCNSLASFPGTALSKGISLSLTRLDLSFNKLKTLPTEIGDLKSLKYLLLSHNQLETLPGELGNCAQLRPSDMVFEEHISCLDLFSNKLAKFSLESGLTNLERLDLGDNSLTELPIELSQSEKLTRLHCYGNKIASVPQEFKSLAKLRDVSFRWNKLVIMPNFLLHARRLRYLDLSGNPLTDLGASGEELAAAWPRLKKLNLYTCKIDSLPNEILSKREFPKLKSVLIARTSAADNVKPEELPQFSVSPLASHAQLETPRLHGKELIIDRIKGCIFGNAIGDAIGLASEFTKSDVAKHFYGYNSKGIDYSDILRDDHRYNWIPGDWTDDTDQAILILDSVFVANGPLMNASRQRTSAGTQVSCNVPGFAERLRDWIKDGFDILGDTKGCGCGATVRSVVLDPEYLKDPEAAATRAWLKANKNAASNGAIMRTSPLGIFDFADTKRVASNARKYCRATHVDPRALASSVASSVCISTMLKMGDQFDPFVAESVQKVADKATIYGMKELDSNEHKSAFLEHFNAQTLEKLRLDEPDAIGYTYKALGCVGWVLQRATDFRRAMEAITLEAGDADTNAAISGAVLGCKLGFSALPREWIDGLVHREFLEEKVELVLRLMGLENTAMLPHEVERSSKRKFYLCGENYVPISAIVPSVVDTSSSSSSPSVLRWKGDITALELDAIVNVVDPTHFPEPVGALDQRIHFAAGPSLRLECKFVDKVSVACAEITPGCKLPASFVIHTAVPVDGNASNLRECYFNVLNAADSAGFASIAFPLLGSSKIGAQAASTLAQEAIATWIEKTAKLERSIKYIVLVTYEARAATSAASGSSSSSSGASLVSST